MNKKTVLLFALIVAVAVVGALLGWPRFGGRQEAPSSTRAQTLAAANTPAGEASGEAPVLAVEVVEVAVGPLQQVLLVTGELRADEQVDLRSEVNGVVESIHFEEGARVRAGELLIKIRDHELQAQLQQARLRRDLAVTREGRARTLLAEDSISQETYDEAANNLRVLEAEIALIEARIDQTEMRAPFNGVIGLRSVSEGSYVSPSIGIASLQSLDPLKLDFSVPERHAGRVQRGDRIRFTVDGVDGSFEGSVYAVEPRIDPGTRTLRIRARAPNPRGLLMPGAFARVDLVLETVAKALTVPSTALVPGLAETVVFIEKDGIAEKRTIRMGMRTQAAVEVLEGVSAGERVIVSGLQQVSDGSRVKAQIVDPATLTLPVQESSAVTVGGLQ